MNTGRCNCGCKRNGERILVNNGCGCGNSRSNACCANTFRPTSGCGCRHEENRCGCRREENRCGCRRDDEHMECRRPCPSCEDRCRRQYRECLRDCRCRDGRERSDDFDNHRGFDSDNSYGED